MSIFNRDTSRTATLELRPGDSESTNRSLAPTHLWYDLSITVEGDAHIQHQVAGHLENGDDSISDPVMGGLVNV